MVEFLPKRQSCVAFSCTRLCGQVVIFDFRTASVAQTINLPQMLYSLAVSPLSGLLAAGGAEASVFLIDGGTGTWRELLGHLHAVQSVAFTSDGSCVLSAGEATMLRWNVR